MVRYATLDDLNQINIIRKQVNDLHVKGYPNFFKPGFSQAIQEYAKEYINQNDKFLLVYEDNGLICSYAMVNVVIKPETPYRYQLQYLEIEEIGTLQTQQGKGYAKEIIQNIKNIALERKLHKIELNMWNFNENASKFYEKVGFKTYRKYLEMIC